MYKAEVISVDEDDHTIGVKIIKHKNSNEEGSIYDDIDNTTFYFEKIDNKTKKMTVAEICKELGYDVEIIKDGDSDGE